MAAATSLPISHATDRQLRFAPTLPDLFFALFFLARFGSLDAWQSLLGDGDTGWHIRTGEYILDHGVPWHDLFSFSRAGQPWYAWEWLSELLFGQIHRWWGLPGVAALGALLVSMAAALLFAWLLRRGGGAWVALAVTLATASAAGVHYLARPHLFSVVLLIAGLWLLEEDRRAHTAWLWVLVPMTGLWANLHGGFIGWLGILGWLVVVSALQRDRAGWQRYGLLMGLSSLATLTNPYGWHLHRHIFEYLKSPWIAAHVAEFQSPQFRSENVLVFALLLLAGVAMAGKVWRKQPFEAGLVAMWSVAALRSARYIPWFAVVSAPLIAGYLSTRWESIAQRANARSGWRILWESSQALGSKARVTPWMAILAVLAMWSVFPKAGLADFPEKSFPVAAVHQNSLLLTGPRIRVLTSDQWADYLIYRLYGGTRVFFDGRSDFYGEAVGDDYRVLLQAGRKSSEVLAAYRFTAALLPLDWPLGQILERDPDWRVMYRDRQAVLLVRTVR